MPQFADWLVAQYAAFSLVPLPRDVPHQAIVRLGCNLLQALLLAVLPLRPTGTLLESKRGFVDKAAQGGFGGGDLHGRSTLRFRTTHQPLATKFDIRLHSGDRAEQKQR